MIRSLWFVICALTGTALLAACGAGQPGPTPVVNIANPAWVYCEEHGGKLDLRQGIVDKPPILQGAAPAADVVIAIFEFAFYMGSILASAAAMHANCHRAGPKA